MRHKKTFKTCCKCLRRNKPPRVIIGHAYPVHVHNIILKDEFYCYLHWCESGQPAPINYKKLIKNEN